MPPQPVPEAGCAIILISSRGIHPVLQVLIWHPLRVCKNAGSLLLIDISWGGVKHQTKPPVEAKSASHSLVRTRGGVMGARHIFAFHWLYFKINSTCVLNIESLFVGEIVDLFDHLIQIINKFRLIFKQFHEFAKDRITVTQHLCPCLIHSTTSQNTTIVKLCLMYDEKTTCLVILQ